jgi:hypothetical protein
MRISKSTDDTMANRKRQTTQWSTEKDRQHKGQQKKDKRINNDLQTLHIKLKNE